MLLDGYFPAEVIYGIPLLCFDGLRLEHFLDDQE
jgi:hypothetical protein